MIDWEKVLPGIIGLFGGGGLVAWAQVYSSRKKTAAEAEKARAEATKATAEASKIAAEGSPDQVTIASLLQALRQLQDQLRTQQEMFTARETFLLGRIDSMEAELVDLRVKNGALIDQISRLETLVRTNGQNAQRAADAITKMADKAHIEFDADTDGAGAGIPG